MRKSLAGVRARVDGSPQRCTSVRFKKIRRLSLRFMLDRRSWKDRRSPALGGRRSVDHGTRVAYQYDGCRCRPCVAAEAAYHVRYAKGLIVGWVDAAPARAHLERLRCRENNRPRVGLRRIAQLSGVPIRRTLQLVLQRRIHSRHGHGAPGVVRTLSERRIVAVTKPSLAEGQTVKQAESYQTRERLRRLIEEELSAARFSQAEQLQTGEGTANSVVCVRARTCNVSVSDLDGVQHSITVNCLHPL